MKYSSRYDQVLAGEVPNIFSTRFSGGALMDLGVYLVYATIGWFGMPSEVHYFPRKISTGVDGLGWGSCVMRPLMSRFNLVKSGILTYLQKSTLIQEH